MTQNLSRPEARIFPDVDPGTIIVHIRDPWDGYTYAATVDCVPELLKIDPNLEVVEF